MAGPPVPWVPTVIHWLRNGSHAPPYRTPPPPSMAVQSHAGSQFCPATAPRAAVRSSVPSDVVLKTVEPGVSEPPSTLTFGGKLVALPA